MASWHLVPRNGSELLPCQKCDQSFSHAVFMMALTAVPISSNPADAGSGT